MPKDYLNDLIKQNGGGENGTQKVKDLLIDHCISNDTFEYLFNNDYFGFIESRRKDIIKELMTTGKIPKILENEPEEVQNEDE